MRYAIGFPQFVADGSFDPAGFGDYLRRAEELGFHSAWAVEQVLGRLPVLSALEVMTFAAARTERLRLGCAVFVTPLHVPVHLAKALSSLDQLSRGRLEVGIGTGGRRPGGAFGVGGERPAARFTEGLRLMRALWTDPEVSFKGDFWQVAEAGMEPKPFQKPHRPIWIGANHPNALRRAARLGDGFFGAGSTPTARFAEQVPVVRRALEEADRDPARFGIAKRVYIAVDDDRERARQQVVQGLQRLYAGAGLADLEAMPVSGTPDDCVRGVRTVADAGAELILFTVLADERQQMERLAAEVIPQVG